MPDRQRPARGDRPAARRLASTLLGLALVLLGLTLALPAAAANTDGWVPQNLPAGCFALDAVSFVDASHGWAVGFDSGTGRTVFIRHH